MGRTVDIAGVYSNLTQPAGAAVVAEHSTVPHCRADPFDPDSPIKALPVEKFPSDMFFVLRVVQLLRGLANAMDPDLDFSSASQASRQNILSVSCQFHVCCQASMAGASCSSR